ncbi:DNA polymerase III subunit gamma [Thermotoga maritima MSB8]|uniref:DNA polymerase III, gamma subunit-related protein n=1 Tax=Thermotoga maritima (strain ATCC 43589 / DSM 3109 / JCM 10099 / NBRC 100826 / MSB8) TaxID=243274 RepID=Q9WZM9_THEMA|nr:DNA polymerase III subunit delta' [Thermotoga maritima]AAD35853.1 DNA polymerase III, gamma subunit-related protein [Thermotoga maritima MSB8]AGL49697.1 DNA polymerase III, gamma subunit-related protein [Thermotoga maritima MSB8]AHD17474.1 DNA polymerase III subunit gamma [Thermotoga maritima MSB8]AKE26688.1 DNA polymerase III subunit gamma [Thermotoga maritima]AKE28552.1 DNA polymerase III subunit gamma [Thermotoga maritima MSB8]
MNDLIRKYAKDQLETLKRIIEKSEGISILINGEDLSYPREVSLELPEYVEKFPPKASDVLEIDPEGENIGIDDIRTIKDFLNYSPELYTRKYVIVHDCERMTQQAANAFLKALEEPPEYAVIVLNTRRWHYLLPTIKSRVFRVVVNVPKEFRDLVKEKIGDLWEELPLLERDFKTALEAYKLGAEKLSGLMESLKVLETEKLLKKVLSKGLEGYLACRELLERFSKVESKEFFALFDQVTNTITGKDAFLLIQRLTRIILHENTWESVEDQKSVSFLDSILRVKIANLNNKLTLMNILAIHRERKRGVNAWS